MDRYRSDRGYTAEAVTDTILRRMPDYVNYICPQFAETDINFQRVPTVDTSNPFIARWIPTPDESMVVIRLKNPRGIDFPYLLSMIPNSFMSRANSIVIYGSQLRPRDATHPHPADPATHGTQEAHRMTAPRPSLLSPPVRMFRMWKWPMRSAFSRSMQSRRPSQATPACRWAWLMSRPCCFHAFSSSMRPTRRGRTVTGSCCRPATVRCCYMRCCI